MTTPRAYTREEAKDAFLNYIRHITRYWATAPERSTQEKLDGLAFSVLNIFDGTTADFPAMDIVLRPHPEDEQYHRDEGENWWPDGLVLNEDATLHEEFYQPEHKA